MKFYSLLLALGSWVLSSCVMVDPATIGNNPVVSGPPPREVAIPGQTRSSAPEPLPMRSDKMPDVEITVANTFDDKVKQLGIEINGRQYIIKNVNAALKMKRSEFSDNGVPRNAVKALYVWDVGAHEEDSTAIYVAVLRGRVYVYESHTVPGLLHDRNWTVLKSYSY